MSMMNVAAYGSSPYGYSGYGDWRNGQGNPADPEYGASGAYGTEDEMDGAYGAYGANDADDVNGADGADDVEDAEDAEKKVSGRKSSPGECETCKNRKYQDGSDEMVSFKAAGHIAPSNAASVVLGHEHEHVSNAYRKADLNNGKVERCSVRLKMDICPECGRTYVSGGVTSTQIRYYNESNPYQQDLKSSDAANKYRGANVDVAA